MRKYQVAECSNCHRLKQIITKGWCSTCYARWRRHGSLEKVVRTRTFCSVEGCLQFVVSHNFCDLHWHRVQTSGDPLKTVRKDWGERSKHPLYQSWCWAKDKSKVGCVEPWKDFWVFVKEIGDRPSPKHRIKLIDESKPFGPDNVIWEQHLVSGKKKGAEYAREHRKVNPDYWHDADLRKHYGITLEQYNAMFESQ